MNVLQGSLVKSLAGHDKNSYFVVLMIEENFVYIADGKERKLEKPKRKNIKHLAVTKEVLDMSEITNKKLRRQLNEFNVEMNKII